MLEKIMSDLKGFYNLPYCLDFEGRPVRIILGDHSCKKSDNYPDEDYFDRLLMQIQELFDKTCLSDKDKIEIGSTIDRLLRLCNYRLSFAFSLNDQKKFLAQFDSCSLEELYNQIQMYKAAIAYYQEYII